VFRSALQDATRAFLAVLDTYTLADLTKPKRALSSLLYKFVELGGGLS
jgi:DNA-binding IscR family transcriptional regulator